MLVRGKRVRTNGRDCQDLQVVESRRDRGRFAELVLAKSGWLDVVRAASELDRVLQGVAAHWPTLALVQRYCAGAQEIQTVHARGFEALRCGLRGDTLRRAWRANPDFRKR